MSINIAARNLEMRGLASLLDISSILLGDFIGEGSDRSVYTLPFDNRYVVKLSNTGNQNIIEWETWNTMRGTKSVRFLAPCISISMRVEALIQCRTSPIPPGREPKQLPAFLCDFKPENFGLLAGRIVAHDYGTVDRILGNSNRLRNVNWR